MGWFARMILGAPWSPERITHHVVDVEALSLGGLSRGDMCSLIDQRFGPPDSFWGRRRGFYTYPALGIAFYGTKEGMIDGFSVYGPGAGEVFGAFTGRWVPEGLGEGPPTEEALVWIFGEPVERRDDDPEGPSLEWSSEVGAEIYADYDTTGRFSELGVAFR